MLRGVGVTLENKTPVMIVHRDTTCGGNGVVLLQNTRKVAEKVDYEDVVKDHVSHKEPKHVCTSALDQGIMQSSVA